MSIERKLTDKFIELFSKHHNPIWARKELEWLVFDIYRNEYEQLSPEEKRDVLDYFDGLRKLHGGM